MAPLFDCIALIVFFVVYRWKNLYDATGALMALSALELMMRIIQGKKITRERWFNVGMLFILGGASLIFRDERFIKLKPTLYYLSVAVVLKLTSGWSRQTLLEETVGHAIKLPRSLWLKLNHSWVIFMSMMAILNAGVAYTTTTSTWMYFKLFGALGSMCAFILGQIIYLSLRNNCDESFID